MNQQRSRRFRAAQEAHVKEEDEQRVRDDWEVEHGEIEGSGEKRKAFDSNCITPGTPFMSNLAICLRYYIADRLQSHPAWKDVGLIKG